jgi:hypothetical protein
VYGWIIQVLVGKASESGKKDAINFELRAGQKSFVLAQTLVLVTFLLGHILRYFEFFGGGNFSRRFSDSWIFFGGGITW